MSFKARFLQLPLKAQIFTSLIIIIVIVAALIIIISGEFATVHERYMLSKKKEYFFNMNQQIIESNIFLMNLILLQYEYLIKLFNYKFFYYLKNQFEFAKDTSSTDSFVEDSKINIYDPTKNILPDYNPLINDDSINVYCYSRIKDKIIKSIRDLIKSNYLFYLNNMKASLDFRIPYYGNISLLGIYLSIFPKTDFLISLNRSEIKDIYDRFDGNMNKFEEDLYEKSEYNYDYNKKYFINYESKELYFIDIMFKIRFYIFENYKKLNGESNKEEYIREQGIFFQNIFYENDTSMFFDGWNSKNSQLYGSNRILKDYLNFILFHLTSKIDIFSIPIYHEKNEIASKSLCYYFLMKQIIYINVTSNEQKNDFNNDLMSHIYNEIFNKDKISINDCYLENYYDIKLSEEIKMKDKIYDYYDLKYTNKVYMFQLREGDISSIIFGILFSYPYFISLKEFYPNFFSFDQIDFVGYSFGHVISKMIDSSTCFLKNIKYFMVLCLLYTWFLFFYVIRIISIRITKEITEPIIRITNIVNLNNINDINQNGDLFEYSLDEEINDFFLLCKQLINGEIKDNNINIKNKVDKNHNNNNMIINNKMILELIENQKSLNKDDEQIYLMKQIHSNKSNSNKNKRRRTNKSSRKNNEQNSLGLSLIKLNTIKNGNNLINNNEDLYSEINDNDSDKENNLKYYENLLNLAEYVYNGRHKKKNIINKMRMNIDHSSTQSIPKLKSEDFAIKDKKENDNKNIRKDCKYITYFWYINAKKNKLFDN